MALHHVWMEGSYEFCNLHCTCGWNNQVFGYSPLPGQDLLRINEKQVARYSLWHLQGHDGSEDAETTSSGNDSPRSDAGRRQGVGR